jgi:2-amino-4-hydroxy-6-hydroxymethyldihydropteridine diphosphokinase
LTGKRYRHETVTRAYVGLGANLGDREATLRAAVDALAAEEGIEVVALSSLRDTEPVGVVGQPRFLNGAAAVETTLGARELLEVLLATEQRFGRVRVPGEHGPRTLDLDLLLYGDERIDEPGLAVPHPRLHERRFVLEPLAELDASVVVPGRGRVESLLAMAGSAGG